MEVCPKGCITAGTAVFPGTGLIPVELRLDACNGCGLCIGACPEPFGLRPESEVAHAAEAYCLRDPTELFGEKVVESPPLRDQPAEAIPLERCEPLVVKGTYASAIGAVLAGCRHVFGYPITPSTEGAELMAKMLPRLGGAFVQAVSEVAAVNMMYGAGAAGLPSMTFTSSPGFSLMLEGISYMIGRRSRGSSSTS